MYFSYMHYGFLPYFKKRKVIFSIVILYALLLRANILNLVNWLPQCPILLYTGFECFGCGLNRAFMELLKGNFSAAFAFNPLIYLYLLLTGIIIILDYKKVTKNQ